MPEDYTPTRRRFKLVTEEPEDERPQRQFEHNNGYEYDDDSEYANHPPPTDSEMELDYQLNGQIYGNGLLQARGALGGSYATLTNSCSTLNGGGYMLNRANDNSLNSFGSSVSAHNHTGSNSGQMTDILFGSRSRAMEDLYKQRTKLKNYGIKRLNVRQHIIITICRDLPIYSILKNFIILSIQWYKMVNKDYSNVVTVRATEFFLAGIWCLVSALLSYIILDGLMVRWMLIYEINAVIVRILSMSLIISLLIEIFNHTFNNEDNEFCLTVWIFISCFLTLYFIVQCFTTNNFDIEKKFNEESNGLTDETELTEISKKRERRTVDLYNLIVFAVVPIGVASFISMVGLVRLLLILRVDIGMEMQRIQQQM